MEKKAGIIVIADDLTGGADTGVQFCRAVGGIYLKHYAAGTVACENGWPTGLSIYTNSRHIDAAEAARRAAAALAGADRSPSSPVYKKIDSCLRGNIGAELDALMRQSGAEISIVAPALPAQGRTTLHDVHRVDEVPVALTEMGRDPLSPVKVSQVSSLLSAQSEFKVGHMDLAWIDQGLFHIEKRLAQLRQDGCKHIVFDALGNEHLQTIAFLARRLLNSENILLAGSAGLATAVAAAAAAEGQEEKRDPRPVVRRWLFVCGSASEVMRRQVDRLTARRDWLHSVLHPAVLSGGEGSHAQLWSEKQAQQDPHSAGMILSVAPLAVQAEERVEAQAILAAVTEKAVSALQGPEYDALFLSGGDTAEAVLHGIDASGICLQEEILPGLVRGAIAGGDYHGLPVITKAGAFGSDDVLLKLIQLLE